MAFCTSCGAALEASTRFCGQCGAPRGGAPSPAPTAGPPAAYGLGGGEAASVGVSPAKLRRLLIGGAVGAVFWIGLFVIIFSFDGCSSTEGSLEASGKPVGDFVFTPTQCRSGEHESFYGVFLLGDDGAAGGVKIVVDPRDGELVQIEVPGSCSGPDNEDCTVVTVEPDGCTRFDVDIKKTNTYVNDIRLLDGHLQLACTFPEGGRVTADVRFESCD